MILQQNLEMMKTEETKKKVTRKEFQDFVRNVILRKLQHHSEMMNLRIK
jgi:hypothetical protein